MNRILTGVAALGCVLAVLATTGTGAHAHAVLESSSPANGAVVTAAPDLVELVYSENIGEPAALEMLGPDGASLSGNDVEVAGNTLRRAFTASGSPAGAYTISYQITSVDGHLISGSLAFTVSGSGAGPAPGAPAAPAAPVSTGDPTRADPAVVVALAAVLAAALLIALGTLRRALAHTDDVTAAR